LNSPFNKKKYSRLLEGLEVSEILLSDLTNMNDRFRIDAEFVKKEYLQIIELLECSQFKRLVNTDTQISHPSEIKRDFVEDGIWFFRTQNLRPLKIEKSNDVYISQDDATRLKNNEIKYGDVLITRTGANYGQTAVYNLDEKAIASSHVLILRNTFFNQFYLATFFNTKYGRKMIDKGMYGAAQPEISPYYILNIPIPIFSEPTQKAIENNYKKSELKIKQSYFLYNQAEDLLLEAIGFKNLRLNTKTTNIKTFKKSFLVTGRLDAEYYQPKYENYIKLIKKYPNGFEPLQTACNLKDGNFTPENAIEYQYIELADIGKSGNITGCTLAQGSELPSRARRMVSMNDVIVSSIEGSLESCALVTENYDNALCSTGFYVIDSHFINSETLLVLFKSEVMQNILKQNCSGTILTAINKTEFSQIPVPLINKATQRQIGALIQKSFALRAESERLLEEAKALVEQEIERTT